MKIIVVKQIKTIIKYIKNSIFYLQKTRKKHYPYHLCKINKKLKNQNQKRKNLLFNYLKIIFSKKLSYKIFNQ